MRLQTTEFPKLAENLQIFSSGATETAKKVEEYQAEITTALENADLIDPYERDYYDYDSYGDLDDQDQGDTVESVLAPFVDIARRYQAQGNWIESAKIYEAVVHACGQKATEGREAESDDYEENYDEEDLYDEDYENYDDYILLRDLLKTRKERETLVAEIKEECAAAALIDIFSAEERWEDLLDIARIHRDAPSFPRMIELLQDRFPEACFDLSRQALLEMTESASDHRYYQQITIRARHLQKIPGHQEEFAQFMGELVERYSRRISMIDELGELAELGKQWQARSRKARYEQIMAGGADKMDIDELMELCPIDEDDREKLRGTGVNWNRAGATLVWSILTAYGGKMDAAEITTAIAEHRNCMPQSAGSQRSSGIRILEALDYIEVDRQGNRLGEVRLMGRKGKKSRARGSK